MSELEQQQEEFEEGWIIINPLGGTWLLNSIREYRQDCIDDFLLSKKDKSITWVDLERLGYSCKKVKIQLIKEK